MTGPNDDDAVSDGESQDEATSSEALVDGEAGQAHVGKGGMAPTGPTLEQPEIDDIERQVAAILITNQGRPHDKQLSVSPQDVS